jgi:hypothetical protein
MPAWRVAGQLYFFIVENRYDKMGEACSTHGTNSAYKVLVGKREDKSSMGNLGVDTRIILKCILKN